MGEGGSKLRKRKKTKGKVVLPGGGVISEIITSSPLGEYHLFIFSVFFYHYSYQLLITAKSTNLSLKKNEEK